MKSDLRFVRRYSVRGGGSAFIQFERGSDGARVDVKVRSHTGDTDRYTRREARLVAEDRIAGSPAIWSVVCDEYATEPTTLADAERTASEIAELGACRLPHVIRNGDGEIAL